MNVYCGEAEDRDMRTGVYTVRDVSCQVCHTVLGWKYVRIPRSLGGANRLTIRAGLRVRPGGEVQGGKIHSRAGDDHRETRSEAGGRHTEDHRGARWTRSRSLTIVLRPFQP